MLSSLRAGLGRVFDIHPEDWRPLLLLQALIVCICTVLAATKTVANSLFVSHVGVAFLPYGYMASALLLAASGIVLIPLIDKLPRLLMYRISALSLAGLFVFSYACMLADQTWVYYVAYLAANVADSLLFLEFWLIAGDLCDARQAKRVFPLVIGWSLLGGMLGSFGTKLLVPFTGTSLLLLISAALLAGTLFLIQALQKAFPRETAAVTAGSGQPALGRLARLRMDWRIVRQTRLVVLICVSLALYSVLAFVTDFVFNVAVVQHFTVDGRIDSDRLTAFFGFFDGLSIGVSLLVQFFLTHRILRMLGITNAQLLLPGAFGTGFLSLLWSTLAGSVRGTFFSALGMRLGQKFLSSSIHRSSMAIVYSPIPSEKRGRSKAFAEGMVQPLGVFVAGALILGIKHRPLWVIAGAAALLSLLYIVSVWRLRKVYVQQILKMFETKNFGMLESFAGMFARIGEKEILDNLCASLGDRDFNVRNFVVELLGQVKSRAAIEPLIELYHKEENVRVGATIVKVLGKLGSSRIVPLLREALESPDDRVRANALEAAMISRSADLLPAMRRALQDNSPRVRANAAIALFSLSPAKDARAAMAALQQMADSGDLPQQLSALYALGEIGNAGGIETLIAASRQGDLRLVDRAIRSLGLTRSEMAVKALLDILPVLPSAQQHLAESALIKLAAVFPEPVIRSLRHPDVYARRHLIAVASTINDKRAKEALKDVALWEIECMHKHRDWQDRVGLLQKKELTVLLGDTFRQLDEQSRKNVLAVLRSLAGNTPAIQQVIKDIFHPNRFVRSSALDALEAVGHKTIAKAFVPLLEAPAAPAAAGDASAEDMLGWVREWLKSPYRWIRACGAFSAGRLRLAALQGELINCLNDSYDLARANALEALAALDAPAHRLYIERMLQDPSPLPRRYAQDLLK